MSGMWIRTRLLSFALTWIPVERFDCKILTCRAAIFKHVLYNKILMDNWDLGKNLLQCIEELNMENAWKTQQFIESSTR
jgi:hypothetical protein